MPKGGRIGHYTSPETRRKIACSLTGYRHSIEMRQKVSEIAKARHASGWANPWKGKHFSPEHRLRISQALKRHQKTEQHIRNVLLASHIKPNKKELWLDSLLNKNFPRKWKYTGDGSLIIGHYIPDFANCDGKKEVIELFGDYWHTKKEKMYWHYTELGRIMAYNSFGYRCLVLWEHELENENLVLEKIRNFISKR